MDIDDELRSWLGTVPQVAIQDGQAPIKKAPSSPMRDTSTDESKHREMTINNSDDKPSKPSLVKEVIHVLREEKSDKASSGNNIGTMKEPQQKMLRVVAIVTVAALLMALIFFIFSLFKMKRVETRTKKRLDEIVEKAQVNNPTLEQMKISSCPSLSSSELSKMSYSERLNMLPVLSGHQYGYVIRNVGNEIQNDFKEASNENNNLSIYARQKLIQGCQIKLGILQSLAMDDVIAYICNFDCTDMSVNLNSLLLGLNKIEKQGVR